MRLCPELSCNTYLVQQYLLLVLFNTNAVLVFVFGDVLCCGARTGDGHAFGERLALPNDGFDAHERALLPLARHLHRAAGATHPPRGRNGSRRREGEAFFFLFFFLSGRRVRQPKSRTPWIDDLDHIDHSHVMI